MPGPALVIIPTYNERENVVRITEQVLAQDPRLEVLVARGDEGWNDDLERYFDKEWDEIEEFVEDHKEAMEEVFEELDEDEDEESHQQAPHNAAPGDVALRLYGINKWANERDVDLVLHLHLNDEAGRAPGERGAHSGAAIYVPDEIYGNADASRAVAEPIFDRLTAYTATSTFGLEQQGIVEDRELIAVGANNTSEVPSILIEYGYLYEPRITGEGAREETLEDFAYATALGLRDYLGTAAPSKFGTKALPYAFSTDLLFTAPTSTAALASTTATSSTVAMDPGQVHGIYALQALLRSLGYYPGTEASLAVCPVSGIVGACTDAAVKAFQRANGLEETGTLGPRTRALLNIAASATPAALPATPPAATLIAPVPPASAGAPSCPAFPTTLVKDADDAAAGGNVSRLQAALAKDPAVYPEALVTGYFGTATQAAIERLQAARGIVQKGEDGYGTLGPRTQAAIAALCR
jgi:peptidoglycan hydrolase-like protein with peptidoglycan-binding domain